MKVQIRTQGEDGKFSTLWISDINQDGYTASEQPAKAKNLTSVEFSELSNWLRQPALGDRVTSFNVIVDDVTIVARGGM